MSGLIPAELDPRFEVFRAWVATQKARAAGSSKKRDQFSDNTARIYASLWRGWVDWLGARNRQWHEATPADVRAFLDGPAPAPEDRRTRAPIQDKKMANYTQRAGACKRGALRGGEHRRAALAIRCHGDGPAAQGAFVPRACEHPHRRDHERHVRRTCRRCPVRFQRRDAAG